MITVSNPIGINQISLIKRCLFGSYTHFCGIQGVRTQGLHVAKHTFLFCNTNFYNG